MYSATFYHFLPLLSLFANFCPFLPLFASFCNFLTLLSLLQRLSFFAIFCHFLPLFVNFLGGQTHTHYANMYVQDKIILFDWKCKISSSALASKVLMQGKKIWHTPGVTHWNYTFLFIIFFLWCTMWSLVAVLNFPKNGVFFTLGAYSSCPTWARDPQKSSKRYISGLFEKSVPNMVTYLCKVLSKLHFPEGDTY